jgi:hypothetical protein
LALGPWKEKGKRKGKEERGKTNMKAGKQAGKQAGNHIFLAMTVVDGLPNAYRGLHGLLSLDHAH